MNPSSNRRPSRRNRNSRRTRARPHRNLTKNITSRRTNRNRRRHSSQRPRTRNIRRTMNNLNTHDIQNIRRRSHNLYTQSLKNRKRTLISRTLLSLISSLTRIRNRLTILSTRHLIHMLTQRNHIRLFISNTINLNPHVNRLLKNSSLISHIANMKLSTLHSQTSRNLRHDHLPQQ